MNIISSQRVIFLVCILLATIGMAVSFFISQEFKSARELAVQEEIREQAQLNSLSISHEIASYLKTLNALKSFISVNEKFTRRQFYQFTDTLLEGEKAIKALEWIPNISHENRAQFETQARQNGFLSFSINERVEDGQLTSARIRDRYFPVYYVNPIEGNERAIGFDLNSHPARRATLEKSEQLKALSASDPIVLVQDPQRAKSVLVFDPVYTDTSLPNAKRQLLGFALLVLRIPDVIKEAPGNFNEVLSVRIEDQTSSEHALPLYLSDDLENASFSAPENFRFSHSLTVADRQWNLSFSVTEAYFQKNNPTSSNYILLIGITLSLLGAASLWLFLTNRINNATFEAEKRLGSELEALVDTTVDAIISIDHNGLIVRFNRAAEEIFQRTKEEVLGENVKLLMPSEYSKQHDQFLHYYQSTGEKKIIGIGRTVTGLRKDGGTFPMDLSVGELPSPNRGYVGIIRDVSERFEYEQKLLRHSLELTRSNEDLAQFAYIASHDLKAPLRAIDNLAGWIDEKVGQYMDEECQGYMKLLRNRVKRLEQLLSSLLEYSRIGQQEKNRETLPLNDIIKSVIDLMEVDRFSIEVDDFPDVFASRTEIEILFRNLIGNSIKHHDKAEGKIRIAYNRLDQHHEFSIHDNGPGIPKDMSSKVFAMFQTLQPRDTVEGSGMGLAFVKKIVERNNASVLVSESCFDRGTAIVILWPSKRGEVNELQRSYTAAC